MIVKVRYKLKHKLQKQHIYTGGHWCKYYKGFSLQTVYRNKLEPYRPLALSTNITIFVTNSIYK